MRLRPDTCLGRCSLTNSLTHTAWVLVKELNHQQIYTYNIYIHAFWLLVWWLHLGYYYKLPGPNPKSLSLSPDPMQTPSRKTLNTKTAENAADHLHGRSRLRPRSPTECLDGTVREGKASPYTRTIIAPPGYRPVCREAVKNDPKPTTQAGRFQGPGAAWPDLPNSAPRSVLACFKGRLSLPG